MRDSPDTFATSVEHGGPLTCRISSWLGGQRLGSLPVISQSWEIGDTADTKTSGELSFQVPNTADLWPSHDEHPLATSGQRLWVQLGYGGERISCGWYRLLDAPQDSGDTLTITAKGLSHEFERAKFLRPWQSEAGSSRVRELAKLVAPMPVVLDDGIGDAPLPVFSQEDDRTQAIIDLTDTWPARWYVGDDAALHVAPVWDDESPGAPVFEIAAGAGLVKMTPKQTTPDPPNAYRVSNIPEGDVAAVTGTWVVPDGPLRWAEPDGRPGPYGQKPAYYSSALLPADQRHLEMIAEVMTRRGLRRKWTAEVVARPDPRIVVGDVGVVSSPRRGIVSLVRVTGLRLTAREAVYSVSLLGDA